MVEVALDQPGVRFPISGMIRLISLDLDQTTFGADLVVSRRVQDSIAQALRRELVVTIATGREARLAAKFARELNLNAPIICAQGSCIYDPVSEKVVRDVRLPPEVLPKILDAATRYHWNIHFETAERLYFPKQSHHPPLLFELLRYSKWARVGDLLRDMPESPNKVIVTHEETTDRQRIVTEMEDSLGREITIVPSHPHLVEGLPKGVDKGRGLAWLADYLGIAQTEVLAIGDSEADIPMLAWAGIGVAMGNGSQACKAAADWIAPSVEEDGVAVALERFVFAEFSSG